MTRRRDLRRHAATQQRLRWEWRQQAFAVLSTHAKLPPVWGMGGGPLHYVIVEEQDWYELPNPTGCQVVQLLLPPTARPNMAAFRAHWDLVMGHPDHPAWRWTYEDGWLIGHPYTLPTRLPLPLIACADDVLADRVVLGLAEDDTVLTHDLNDNHHGIIGGRTQRGKTYLLLLYAIHLIAAGRLQAFIVLDPKGGQYPMLEVPPGHPAAWNPAACTGLCVAQPTFAADGRLIDYRALVDAAEAMDRETGRRRIHAQASAALIPPSFYRQARVVGVFDEAADLLAPDPKPDAKDKSEGAGNARARNWQREIIERILTHEAMMGGGFGMTVLPAAQSPRRDTIPGVVHANTAFKAYLGKGDSTELGIVFGRGFGLPPSPLDLPGRGVWLNNRIGAAVTDPYLAFQAYLPDLDRLARLVEGFTPATLPTVTGSPNGHAAHLPSL